MALTDDDGLDATVLTAATADVARAHPGLEIRESGDLTLDEAIDERVADDLGSAEGISLPITLALMLLAFGALVAAGIPVLLAVTSVAATIGIMAPVSHLVHAEATVTSMIVLIGMAVGVDYSLFYLKREREERAKGRTTLDAVAIAAETSGHSILVSGGAVIAALSGLFLVGDATFDSLAVGSILVVGIAVLGSITVLPGAAGQARPLGRPAAGAAAVAAQRAHRTGRHEPPAAGTGAAPPASLRWCCQRSSSARSPCPRWDCAPTRRNLDTLPASIPEVQTMREITAAFPSEGADRGGGRPWRRGRPAAGRGGTGRPGRPGRRDR